MKILVIASVFFLATVAPSFAQKPAFVSNVPDGSKVYIDPMDGFENYLAAAIQKKKVPLTVVADKSVADFEISGSAEHIKAGWAKIVFEGNVHSDERASISVVNLKTKEIAYAYAVDKKSTMHGMQTSAEACAKHLYDHMKGKE